MIRAAVPRVSRTLMTVMATAVLLQACGGGSPREDGPPSSASLPPLPPDATPRVEPKSRYGNPPTYVVNGVRYSVLDSSEGFVERGVASWYGEKFHGRRTSSGETYDMHLMTAAHKSLPLPTYVEVTNLDNGRRAVVRVNDRGPFHDNRIIDLSYSAARKLDIVRNGTGLVEIRTISADGATQPVSLPAPAQARRPTTVSSPPRLYLQAGAFSDLENAQRLRSRLVSFPGATVVVQEVVLGGQRLFRVRLGPLSGVAQADQLAADITAAGMDLPRIVIE